MMSVRPQCRYNEEDSHSCEQKETCAIVFGLVGKKQIQHHDRYIGEPHKIRDHKDLTERDVVVQIHMDHLIGFGHGMLKMPEPKPVYDTVADQGKGVAVLFKENPVRCVHKISSVFAGQTSTV